MVTEMKNSSQETIEDILSINHVFSRVNDMVINISSAIEQQSIALQCNAASTMQIADGVKEVSAKVTQTNESAGHIAEQVNNMAQGAGGVSSNTKKAHAVTGEVSVSISKINDDINGNKAGIDKINHEYKTLVDIIGDLNQSIGEFKLFGSEQPA